MKDFSKEELQYIFNNAKSKVKLAEALGITSKNGTTMNKQIEEYASIINFDTSIICLQKQRIKKRLLAEEEYYKSPKFCKACGKMLSYQQRNGQFCSQSCSATYTNTSRGSVTKGKTKNAICIDCGKNIEIALTADASKCRCADCKKRRKHNSKHRSIDCKKRRKCTKKIYRIFKTDELECEYCGKLYIPKILPSGNISISKYCSSDCHKHAKSENAKNTYKRLLDEGRFQGWKSRNIISYAERFWTDVLNNNGILYQREYHFNKKYFLDFYICKNGKIIDLEIDGKQHKYSERADHDRVRDEYLTSNGVIVYRIPWNNINSKEGSDEMKIKIKDFINFYEQL